MGGACRIASIESSNYERVSHQDRGQGIGDLRVGNTVHHVRLKSTVFRDNHMRQRGHFDLIDRREVVRRGAVEVEVVVGWGQRGSHQLHHEINISHSATWCII